MGYLPELPPLYMDMTVKEYLDFVAELKKLEKKPAGRICEGSHENYKNRGSIGKTDP